MRKCAIWNSNQRVSTLLDADRYSILWTRTSHPFDKPFTSICILSRVPKGRPTFILVFDKILLLVIAKWNYSFNDKRSFWNKLMEDILLRKKQIYLFSCWFLRSHNYITTSCKKNSLTVQVSVATTPWPKNSLNRGKREVVGKSSNKIFRRVGRVACNSNYVLQTTSYFKKRPAYVTRALASSKLACLPNDLNATLKYTPDRVGGD